MTKPARVASGVKLSWFQVPKALGARVSLTHRGNKEGISGDKARTKASGNGNNCQPTSKIPTRISNSGAAIFQTTCFLERAWRVTQAAAMITDNATSTNCPSGCRPPINHGATSNTAAKPPSTICNSGSFIVGKCQEAQFSDSDFAEKSKK